MLIQFSVKNYKTFKDMVTLSLVASNYDKITRESENVSVDENFNLRLLKSAVVFGANASGKSKLIEAFRFMKDFVISSSKDSQKGEVIDVEPFELNEETSSEPCEFEVVFSYKNVMYRYGFEVDFDKVVSEWLFTKQNTKEIELFNREKQNFEIHSRNFSKGNMLVKEGLVRNNSLLLSVAAQFNDEISNNILEWFENFNVIFSLEDYEFRGNTIEKIKTDTGKKQILNYLKTADIGIEDIEFESYDKGKYKKNPLDLIKTTKSVFKGNEKVSTTSFFLNSEESEGTQKYFYLLGPIIDALENGSTLVVDELDSQLHPNLVAKIVELFNSKDFNKNNAQLIFNTHDVNLLSTKLMRRDQVWFTDKNKFGEASLYSLADFKKEGTIRKDEPFEENYLRGKYGAVPFLGLFDEML